MLTKLCNPVTEHTYINNTYVHMRVHRYIYVLCPFLFPLPKTHEIY